MSLRIDRNANTDKRQQRAFQRLRTGALTGSISTTAPLTNSGTTISLTLGGSGGLVTTAGTLGIKLDATGIGSGLSLSANGLKMATLTNKGDLLSVSTTLLRVPVGTNGQMLTAQSGQASGLLWANASPLTTKGDIYGFTTTNARLGVGADGTILSAASAQTTGLLWITAPPAPLTTKGDLYTFSTLAARLPVGANTFVLTADSTQATGMKWAAAAGFTPTVNGGLAVDGSNNAYVLGMRTDAVGTAPANNGEMWFDTTSLRPSVYDAAFGLLPIPRTLSSQASNSTSIANTTTETAFPETVTINPSLLKSGTTLRIRAGGRYSTTGTPTIALRAKLGTSVIVDLGAINAVTNASSKRWYIEGVFRVRTNAGLGTGTYDSLGQYSIQDGNFYVDTHGAAGTDLSLTSADLQVTCQWGTASASNTARCDLFVAEVVQ